MGPSLSSALTFWGVAERFSGRHMDVFVASPTIGRFMLVLRGTDTLQAPRWLRHPSSCLPSPRRHCVLGRDVTLSLALSRWWSFPFCSPHAAGGAHWPAHSAGQSVCGSGIT
jgi:hypothetical protein